jgi:uncharacterized protein YqjF (DUF2071 family)
MNEPRRFLTAQWRHLVMLNYEVDPAVLAPYVPRGLMLDSFAGRYYASVVGFLFDQTRLFGWSVPLHRRFPEVNLRFYVRRPMEGGDRRGVMFVKELVPRMAVACVARWFYRENYRIVPMRWSAGRNGHAHGHANGSQSLTEYTWRFGRRWNSLRASVVGEPTPPIAGSLEQFIVEHYWGYGRASDGSALEFRVEHPPWRVWRTGETELRCDGATLYGQPWGRILSHPADSALVAEGSAVTVYRARRCE